MRQALLAALRKPAQQGRRGGRAIRGRLIRRHTCHGCGVRASEAVHLVGQVGLCVDARPHDDEHLRARVLTQHLLCQVAVRLSADAIQVLQMSEAELVRAGKCTGAVSKAHEQEQEAAGVGGLPANTRSAGADSAPALPGGRAAACGRLCFAQHLLCPVGVRQRCASSAQRTGAGARGSGRRCARRE